MKKENLAGRRCMFFVLLALVMETGLFSWRHSYENANMHLGNGENDKAAACYMWAIMLDPYKPEAYGGALAALDDDRGMEWNIYGYTQSEPDSAENKRLVRFIKNKASRNKISKTRLNALAQLHNTLEKYGGVAIETDGIVRVLYNSAGQPVAKGNLYDASVRWAPAWTRLYHADGVTVKEKTFYDTQNGERINVNTYNEDGVMISETFYNPDTAMVTKETVYNATGQIICETVYDADGNTDKKTDYTYNENGQLLAENIYTGDGNKTVQYMYDDTGRLQNVTYMNRADGTVIWDIDYGYDGDTVVSVKEDGNKTTVTTVVNGETVKIEHMRWMQTSLTDNTKVLKPDRTEYYADGRLVKKEEYVYRSGRLESVTYYKDGTVCYEEYYAKKYGKHFLEKAFVYDGRERPLEKIYYKTDGKAHYSEKYTYSGSGNDYIYEKYNSRGNMVARFTDRGNGTVEEYFSTEGQLMYYTEPNGTSYYPAADMTGSRPLTQEETEKVNRVLTLGDYKNSHPLECLLAVSSFGRPEEISIASLVSSIAAQARSTDRKGQYRVFRLTAEEKQELAVLKTMGVEIDYDNIETNGGWLYCVYYSTVDDILEEYMGLLTKDTVNRDDVLKSGVYNWYYTAGRTWGNFYCIGGEVNDSWLKLYFDYKTRIFRREGDRYYLHALIEETNKGKENTYKAPQTSVRDDRKEYAVKDVSIYIPAGRGAGYQRAVALYTDCLQAVADELKSDWDGQFSCQALSYALVDLSRDGIPELVTRAPDPFAPYDVYMVINGQLQHIDTVGGYGGDGGVTVLPSGYMAGHMDKIDFEWYDFYWYNADGGIKGFHFGTDKDYYRDDVKYKVEGEYVSRDEYIWKTEEYIKLYYADNRYDVEWYSLQEKI